MEVAISIKDLLLFLLGAGGVVLIVFLIICVKNLIDTLKSTNIILKDVEEISKIAADRAKDVNGIIEDVSESVGVVAKNLKGNGSLIKTISSAIGLLTSLKGMFTEKKTAEGEKKAENKRGK
jgi:predicted PurR-regulated permease PerM